MSNPKDCIGVDSNPTSLVYKSLMDKQILAQTRENSSIIQITMTSELIHVLGYHVYPNKNT